MQLPKSICCGLETLSVLFVCVFFLNKKMMLFRPRICRIFPAENQMVSFMRTLSVFQVLRRKYVTSIQHRPSVDFARFTSFFVLIKKCCRQNVINRS